MGNNTNDTKIFFREELLKWNAFHNDRSLPWKGIDNPYFIWLSEIILQQTRAEQGLPYYLKFTEHYPTVNDLANAEEDEVMKLWQGLGYYSRARNLHAAAKYIASEKAGEFPDTYDEIIKLKGVGPYTAAAIASFAFKLPHAVVDGNVYRVLSRFFGIEQAIDSTKGKKEFAVLAQELIDKDEPASYNQAIMDFGAKQCSPAKPNCMYCPLVHRCSAFMEGKTAILPFKEKKIKKKERFFVYVVLKEEGQFLIKKRLEPGIWQNLYDFSLIETEKHCEEAELNQLLNNRLEGYEFETVKCSKAYIHILTHQKIHVRFLTVDIKGQYKQDYRKVETENLKRYAFPKVIINFFEDEGINV